MKTLLVLRHGKSDWDAAFGTDEERPLAERGRAAAAQIGLFIANAGDSPDLALTSPAVRARDTAFLARQAGQWEAQIHEQRVLYEGSIPGILELIRSTDDRHGTLLLAGHQPTSGNIVASLVGGGRYRFPTAAVACIEFPDGWRDIRPNTGELKWFVIPRMFG